MTGLQYIGLEGVTKDCVDAVVNLVQCRVGISNARILTCAKRHCILLSADGIENAYLVKSGFTSGYQGTGPRGLSEVLALLYSCDVDIDECDVSPPQMRRANASTLTTRDLDAIRSATRVLPTRWSEYVREDDWPTDNEGNLWLKLFPPVMPYGIIDPRILDLAKTFWSNPDSHLMDGHRRLEDVVRKRMGSKEIGRKLYGEAFHGNSPRLRWKDCEPSEQDGRAQLFIGSTMAYRNPRAHKVLKHTERDALTEFLLLNHLFRLEARAYKPRAKKGP